MVDAALKCLQLRIRALCSRGLYGCFAWPENAAVSYEKLRRCSAAEIVIAAEKAIYRANC
jgi:hypothetical protein